MEKSNIIPIEKGRINVTIATLKRIGDALGVDFKDLLS
jgi:transcriptional regulator with XRE-family HTH domain